ncbi:MAG: carbonic anhydrase family protein [Verrucomicrobiota bacterium]
MKKALLSLTLASAFIGAAIMAEPAKNASPAPASAVSARPAHWGYEGDYGPKYWGSLSPAYAVADQGKAQSPIDFAEAGTTTPKDWKINYQSTSLKIAHHEHVLDIADNGHTIQVTVEEGSTLVTGRNTYALKQFHFHTPSEHTINGKHFPMEAHFVHQSADGKFAVVAVLFAEDTPNENLAKLIANFPKAKGDARHLPEVQVDLAFHLPKKNTGYTYVGSFTTPPCTEDVEWLVFSEPVLASREQFEAFATRLHQNNRPVQPRNGRLIETVTTAGVIAP